MARLTNCDSSRVYAIRSSRVAANAVWPTCVEMQHLTSDLGCWPVLSKAPRAPVDAPLLAIACTSVRNAVDRCTALYPADLATDLHVI